MTVWEAVEPSCSLLGSARGRPDHPRSPHPSRLHLFHCPVLIPSSHTLLPFRDIPERGIRRMPAGAAAYEVEFGSGPSPWR